MRILGVLYLFFLVQGDVGALDGVLDGTAALARRKRGWSFSSGSSRRVTQRPIGWTVSNGTVQRPPQASYVPIYQSRPNRLFARPTQSMTRQLVKAALAVGVVGAVSAYSKPVQPSTKSPSQRAEERERRRQQRLSRRSTTTAIPPIDGNSTAAAVPLAASELIPVMVQDANKLLQVVYVRRDQIPPGGIPIAMQGPFPAGPAAQPQQQPSPIGQPPLQAPLVNSGTEPIQTVPVLPIPPAQP